LSKKICFLGFSTLVLIIAFLIVSLTFAQDEWDYCTISAYGTFLEEPGEYGFTFITADPPTGSEIPNTIYVVRYSSGENYTNTLSSGDRVQVSILDAVVDIMDFTETSEPDHFIITFEGEARYVRLNQVDIPEFPPILIVPLFMTATLLALIYRRKRKV